MTDVLSIADLIHSNADNISTFLIIAALIAAFAIGIAEYKSKLWEYITNRRNRLWFIYDLLMFAAILFTWKREWIRVYWLIGTVVLWVAYTIVIIFSLKPKRFMNYTNPVLMRYEKWLNKSGACHV